MQNTKYFDIKTFNDYLSDIVSGSLSTKARKPNSENVYVESLQESSFQLLESDFLESQSITQGDYTSKYGTKGHWEELRLRFGILEHFHEKNLFQKGNIELEFR